MGLFKISGRLSCHNYIAKYILTYGSQKEKITERSPLGARFLQGRGHLRQGNSLLFQRFNGAKYEYFVKWQDYPPEDNTWEPEEHLETVLDLVRQFNEANPDKGKRKKEGKRENPPKVQKKEEPRAPPPSHPQRHTTPEKKSQPRKRAKEEVAPQPKRESKMDVEAPQKMPFKHEEIVIESSENEIPPTTKRGRKRLIKDKDGEPVSVPVPTADIKTEKAPVEKMVRNIVDQGQGRIEQKKKLLEKEKEVMKRRLSEEWYMESPYMLGSIFTHYVENRSIVYGINVVNKEGDTICTTEIKARDMDIIDAAKARNYMLKTLSDALKEQERVNTMERWWKQK